MCIIIDTNVLNQVFDRSNADHYDFQPVYDWIYDGDGVIVYGGTKYLQEVTRYAKILNEFRNIGKAKRIPTVDVDSREREINQEIHEDDFDDQHLVALLVVSGCKLICSLDARAYKYFQHRKYFTRKNQPRIYKRRSHRSLLHDRNIAPCCKPVIKHNKKGRENFPKL